MANPNFEGIYSTDNIWRGTDDTRCLTDDLDAIENDIEDLETGKAENDHTHSDYASSEHTHDGYASSDHTHSDYAESGHTHSEYAGTSHEHTGYASSDHTHSDYAAISHGHDYAASAHTHTPASIGAAASEHAHDYAAHNHTHTPSDIGAAASVHAHDYAAPNHTHTPASIGAAAKTHTHDYAGATHSHEQSEIAGLESVLAAKADAAAMSDKADLVDGKIPASQLPGFVDDVLEFANQAAFPGTGESGKIYVAQDTDKTYRWSGTSYVEISASLALGESAASAYRGDRGKIAYDHSQNSNVHVTAAQKATWDGKAAGNHTHTPDSVGAAASDHTHDYAESDHTHTIASIGAAAAVHSHDYAESDHSHTPASIGAAAAVHSHDYAAPNHTHTPAAIGAAASTHTHAGFAASNHTHSNYAGSGHSHSNYAASSHTHSGYAASSHTHSGYATTGHTAHSGEVVVNKANGPGVTLQCTNSTGVKSRIHKNASDTADYGTIISDYDSSGKRDYLTIRRSAPVVGNKLLLNVEDPNGGATEMFQLYGEHNKPGVLWSGATYMLNGQTVEPSKPLSECRTGWMLLWSDYDPDTKTSNDAEFVTTMIPRITPTGASWSGKSFYCEIPRHIGSNYADVSTEKRVIKMLYVYNNKITGHAANDQDTRTDVVLRAVYEF